MAFIHHLLLVSRKCLLAALLFCAWYMFICCFFNLKYIIKSFFIAEIIAIFCRPIKIPISSSTYFLLFFEKYARVMSDEGQEIRSAQLAGVIFAFCILFILLSLFLEYCLSFFRSNFLILVFRGKTNFCFFSHRLVEISFE